VVDLYSEQGKYDWISIWTVPFVMAIIFLAGFLFLFREDVRNRVAVQRT
jgi:cbb3-type cytochrome oxidase subunit 3